MNPIFPIGHILDRDFRQTACIREQHNYATGRMWCTRSHRKGFPSVGIFEGELGRLKRATECQ